MPLPPLKKPLNFNLPPEFANNPNISVGPAAGPMRQTSGWGQQFNVPDRGAVGGVGPGPSFGDLQMQAAGMMSPAGITDSSPASVVMASRSIDASVGPQTGTPISREIAPGGTSSGASEFSLDPGEAGGAAAALDMQPAASQAPMATPDTSQNAPLPEVSQAPQGTDWGQVGSQVQGAIGGLQQALGGGAEAPAAPQQMMQAPQVPVDVAPNLPQMAPTGMGPGMAQSAQAAQTGRAGQAQQPDRMGRIKNLLQTMMAR